MQRIKLEVFKEFFKKDLTGNEIDFLIALTYVQDNRGIALRANTCWSNQNRYLLTCM